MIDSKQTGFTLVEMLITAAILASILVTAGTFLITSNRSQQTAVDLGSRVDAHAFVASLLNYDFRIACYGIEDSCTAHVQPDGKAAKVWYFEERFGENVAKDVGWSLQGGNLIRDENHAPNKYQNTSIVLRNVEHFDATMPSRQLINFEIVRRGEEPIIVSVAILNPIPVEEESQ